MNQNSNPPFFQDFDDFIGLFILSLIFLLIIALIYYFSPGTPGSWGPDINFSYILDFIIPKHIIQLVVVDFWGFQDLHSLESFLNYHRHFFTRVLLKFAQDYPNLGSKFLASDLSHYIFGTLKIICSCPFSIRLIYFILFIYIFYFVFKDDRNR